MIELKENRDKENKLVYNVFVDGEHIEGLVVEKDLGKDGLILMHPDYDVEPLKKLTFSDLIESPIDLIYVQIESPLEGLMFTSELDWEAKVKENPIFQKLKEKGRLHKTDREDFLLAGLKLAEVEKDFKISFPLTSFNNLDSW